MIDYKQEIVAEIASKTGIQLIYSSFDRPEILPAVTYREIDNSVVANGDTLWYSDIKFEFKIYDTSLGGIAATAIALDDALREMGFTRYGSSELNQRSYIVKVLRYVAIGYKR